MSEMPRPGNLAPDFEGTTQTGERLRLSDLRGRPVALYFYPEDDTSGCTKQACNLRDHYGALLAAGVAVVGVSPDDEASHERFAEKYSLPFPLVADPKKEIAEAYGVWGPKNLYGVLRMGLKRTTFLIGPDGRVLHIFKRPNTSGHAEEILEKLQAA
jgi:peroxiredoxin Q/BCP